MSYFVLGAELSRLFVFAALSFACVGKILTFKQFSTDLNESFGVKSSISGALTVLLIALEGVLSILILINNPMTEMAMLGALILLSTFTLVILVALIQNRSIRCNCFGQSNDTITYYDVSRNVLLIIACGFYLLNNDNMPISSGVQLLLGTMALSCLIIATHLSDIALVNRDPKAN